MRDLEEMAIIKISEKCFIFVDEYMENVITSSLWSSAVEKQQTVEALVDVLMKQELSKESKIEYIDALFNELNFKFQQHLRPIDAYYDEILERLYSGVHFSKEQIEQDMEMFDSAYTLMNQAFN